MKKALYYLVGLIAISLQACSYDDESLDKLVLPNPTSPKEVSITENYTKIAHRCIIGGDLSDADNLNALYMQSIDKNFTPNLIFQRRQYSTLYDRCMQKVAHNGHTEYIDKILVRPLRLASISRSFYAQDNYEDGAYWFNKLINMQGITKGYYTAGRIFINDPKTLSYGAQLLRESALNGNNEARQLLMRINSPNNLKRQYSQIEKDL